MTDSDYANPIIKRSVGGAAGDGTINGALTVDAIYGTAGQLVLAGNENGLLGNSTVVNSTLGNFKVNGNAGLTMFAVGQAPPSIYRVDGVPTQGKGFGTIYGLDNRHGITAIDAAALPLYTTTASNQLYRLTARILATAGTTPTASYVITWTEGGTVMTKTLSIAATFVDSDLSIIIQPDNATSITAQVTAMGGTGTTINVATTVEQMA